MTFQRLRDLLDRNITEAQLNSGVAVVFHRLLLNDGAGSGFNDGHRDNVALFVEDLRHADLLANDAFLHFYTSLVIGWPPALCGSRLVPSGFTALPQPKRKPT